MMAFQVDDMTCGHCVATITKSVRRIDPDAGVEIDLGRHLVMIEPAAAGSDTLRAAIAEAGYTPVAVQPAAAAAAPTARRGSCCGHCG